MRNRYFTSLGTFRPRPATVLLVVGLWTAFASPSFATPQFAREQNVNCAACHTVPPMLNETGLSFQVSGTRFEGKGRSQEPVEGSVPMAAWLTFRQEHRTDDDGSGALEDFFLPKVELVSGGTLGESLNYFVEWRVVSLSLQSDGSLRSRGGRFEDLFLEWGNGPHAVKVGQYRSINQVDVSLRLSTSEPLLLRNGLRTGTDDDARLNSLQTFSPASRSPSIGYSLQSVEGNRASDGLFHFVTVPFVGEFSIPLSDEADETASFEFDEAKGVYFETFYRRGLSSIGAHSFVDGDGAWLVNGIVAADHEDWFVQAGFGLDEEEGRDTRTRWSGQIERLFAPSPTLRGMAGFRVEDVSDDAQRVTYVPYVAIAAPSTRHTLLLQLQFQERRGSDTFVADLSALF